MNKLVIAITTFLLAGCQATLPENESNETEAPVTSLTSSGEVVIKPVKNIEQSPSNPGEYPIQYRYIISNYNKSPNTILFKPIEYETTSKEKAWATCAKINNSSQLFLIKNNTVIENLSSKDIVQKCEKLKIEQETKENAYYLLNMEKAVDNFKSLVDDPSKSHLFGEPPNNPEKIILKQLSYFTPNFDNVILEDISVRKTFFLVNDEPIYSYLIFANLLTQKDNLKITKKSIFYYKDGVLLNHKVFHEENTSVKGAILKNLFEEDTEEQSINTTTTKKASSNIKAKNNKTNSAKNQKNKTLNSNAKNKAKPTLPKKIVSKKNKS